MKKKLMLIVSVLLVFVLLTGCETEKEINPDAKKFKEDYESLNGKTNARGLEHRTLNISEDNPFVYATGDDIVKLVEDKASFFVYFGDKQCPWCRSVIEKAIEVAKDYNVKKIYYVNVWDDDHNEIIRDVYSVNEDGVAEKTQDGTAAYYKLLDYFKDVLSDYSLKDAEGNPIESPEKRIYAPNFIFVRNGKASMMVEGIPEGLTDARAELTKELLEDEEKQFEKIFSYANMCDQDTPC